MNHSNPRLTTRNKIVNVIKSMDGQDNISVRPVNGDFNEFTVVGTQIQNRVSKHALQFKFKWYNFEETPRYLGYIVNHDGTITGKSVISLKTPNDALDFAFGYRMMAKLRSKQRAA